MNKIEKMVKIPIPTPEQGQLYGSGGYLYILASVCNGLYCAINLETGDHWKPATQYADLAVQGLTFYSASATITVNPND